MGTGDIDLEWNAFINGGPYAADEQSFIQKEKCVGSEIPKCSDIYISTKTMIAFLNNKIPLADVFWNVPVIPYEKRSEGVIKKQMKVSCMNKQEVDVLDARIASEKTINVDIISKVDNPTARKIKFKDVRKINVGLCKKDLMCYRTKKKGAFYNCFVLILRVKTKGRFREVHVKVFNTGKLEIPGIQDNACLFKALDCLIDILQPLTCPSLSYSRTDIETVLINSNFSANYYIDRDKFYDTLKYKYGLHVIYDPCSYPGIQCKFYYNEVNPEKNGKCMCNNRCNKKGKGKGVNDCLEISFMIFRTGSVLIVGHCEEYVLREIYDFLCGVLRAEYAAISTLTPSRTKPKGKTTKLRKKSILVTKDPVDKA
jgi:hypothetical protein